MGAAIQNSGVLVGLGAKLVSVALIFVVVLGVVGLLKGLRRGICRQIIRSITVALSAVLSVVICNRMYVTIMEKIGGMSMEQLLEAIPTELPAEIVQILQNLELSTVTTLASLPVGLVLVPVMFMVLFFVISAVMLLVHAVLCGIFRFTKKNNNFVTRLLGGALGAVQGVAVAALFLIPAFGTAGVYRDFVANVNTEDGVSDAESAVICFYESYVKETTESPLYVATMKLGGDLLYKKLTTLPATAGTQQSDCAAHANACGGLVMDFADLMGADLTALKPEEKRAVLSMIDRLGTDDYLADITAGLLRFAATAAEDGALNMEIGEPYDSLLKSAVLIFRDSNKDNVQEDLTTVAEVWFILSDSGVMTAFGENPDGALGMMVQRNDGGQTVINQVISTLGENPRTKVLVGELAEISVSLMCGDIGMDKEVVEQTYESIKAGVNKLLRIDRDSYGTEEAFQTAVADSLNDTLMDNDIVLEPEIIDSMAEYVAKEMDEGGSLAGLDEMTEDELNNLLFSYYDAYLEYLNGGAQP